MTPLRSFPQHAAVLQVLSRLQRFDLHGPISRLAKRVAPGLPLAVILDTSQRSARIVRARRFVWAATTWSTGWSLTEIGDLFGVDHTSILNACRIREIELALLYGEPAPAHLRAPAVPLRKTMPPPAFLGPIKEERPRLPTKPAQPLESPPTRKATP
jgi:hypothetical protein